MPALPRTWISKPPTWIDEASASCAAVPAWRDGSGVPSVSNTTMNSSPPKRNAWLPAFKVALRRRASVRNTSSPAAWPSESLMVLKSSRSSSNAFDEVDVDRRLAADERHVVQVLVDAVAVDQQQHPGVVVARGEEATHAEVAVRAVVHHVEAAHGAQRVGQRAMAQRPDLGGGDHRDGTRGGAAPLRRARRAGDFEVEQVVERQIGQLGGGGLRRAGLGGVQRSADQHGGQGQGRCHAWRAWWRSNSSGSWKRYSSRRRRGVARARMRTAGRRRRYRSRIGSQAACLKASEHPGQCRVVRPDAWTSGASALTGKPMKPLHRPPGAEFMQEESPPPNGAVAGRRQFVTPARGTVSYCFDDGASSFRGRFTNRDPIPLSAQRGTIGATVREGHRRTRGVDTWACALPGPSWH